MGHIGVLLVAGLIGFGLWARAARVELDTQYQQRALAIAEATSAIPQVGSALAVGRPEGIQPLAQDIARSTGASYVVVLDRFGMRYSHPNPALIGQRVEEPVVALDGHAHVGIDPGSLGRSANGKAPVLGPDRAVVGEVSVGVVETEIAVKAGAELISLAIYLAVALAIGIGVATVLARQLKRQTFGLELDEIAALLQEREATLHGIREGVVAVDPQGRFSLVNDQAHQLLGTTPRDVGRSVAQVLPEGALRELLASEGPERGRVTDQLVMGTDRILVASRMRVTHGGQGLGAVVTLRDRTELEEALRELDEVRRLTDALRAQQHEFANRMHVMSGLLEMRRYDEAIGYATEIDGATSGRLVELASTIDNPRLVALLIAKMTVAHERGVRLTVRTDTVNTASPVTLAEVSADAVVSIMGNLIDNAIDAAIDAAADAQTHAGESPTVTVELAHDDRGLVIDVVDSGSGIPPDMVETIFTGGWSTKAEVLGRTRGIGLALVRQLVTQLGGSIAVGEGRGARFQVIIPRTRAGTRP
jgi:two-component system CitB family sensor kinase